MLRIRLSRKGKKKQPQYRVVVADVKFKRDGRFVENIGFYNPLTDPPTVDIKEGRALYWLSVGAQPSDPVKHLLEKQGTYDRLKRLHAGEELDALAAEYAGDTAGEAKDEKPAAKAKKSKSEEAADEVVAEAPAEGEAPAEEETPAEEEPQAAVETPAEEAPAEDEPAAEEDTPAEDESPAAEDEADEEEDSK